MVVVIMGVSSMLLGGVGSFASSRIDMDEEGRRPGRDCGLC